MRFPWLQKTANIAVIGLSTFVLSALVVYWILIGTLLNPGFYRHVFESESVTAAFEKASDALADNGAFYVSGASLKENAYDLLEGMLRMIRHKDMSLSSIRLEAESTESLRAAVLSAVPDEGSGIPEITEIHPFVMTYFMPGSESIFAGLVWLQECFALLQSLVPFLGLIALAALLLPKRASRKIRQTLSASGILLIFVAFALIVLRKKLLLSPLSVVFPDAEVFIGPIVRRVSSLLFLSVISAGAFMLLSAPVFNFPRASRTIDHCSGTVAVILLILAGVQMLLFNQEVFAISLQTMKNHEPQVNVLSQESDTVHSLIIKLREGGTDAPVLDARMILVRLDQNDEPVSAVTDGLGNARFILPQGRYLLYADASTINRAYHAFEPVILQLDRPDSSWYTFHLTRIEDSEIIQETQEEMDMRLNRHQQPELK